MSPPLQPPHYYRTDDLQELNQKIQHRFIRDVVKPYGPAARRPPVAREYRVPDLRPRRESTTLRKTPIGETTGHKEINPYTIYRREAFEPPQATPPPAREEVVVRLSCLDVHRHARDCPICGRLYLSYSPVYIGVILILVLVIVFLLKNIMEKPRGLKTQGVVMET
jgi:hypothetical protein